MTADYGEIAFTPSVAEEQARHGSRTFYARRQARRGEAHGAEPLGEEEVAFVAQRDGFLRVLDEHQLAWADFRGNLDYISVGNLRDNPRVSMIALDYVQQQRLKVFGHARVIDGADDPGLVEELADPSYPAEIQHAVVVTVDAYDWNCRQHITPRYSAAEIDRFVGPLRRDLEACRAENRELRRRLTVE
jgi:predicted pyridoxine 5'-phosphate oxidase superfamily flavin-nucleotide-binding protein